MVLLVVLLWLVTYAAGQYSRSRHVFATGIRVVGTSTLIKLMVHQVTNVERGSKNRVVGYTLLDWCLAWVWADLWLRMCVVYAQMKTELALAHGEQLGR